MHTRSKFSVLLTTGLSGLLLLSSCAPSLPMTKKSTLQLPQAYPNQDKDTSGTGTGDIDWNKFFADPILRDYINQAITNNQDLRMIEQDLFIAQNEIMARQGEYLPKVGVKAQAAANQTQRFSPIVGEDPVHSTNWGAAASWELDIWGRLRNAAKAAYLDYLGTIEGKRFKTTRLVAEVSNTYFELMALDKELEIVTSYVEILREIRGMVSLQQVAGRTTSLAVKRFEAEVLKNQARISRLNQEIIVTENQMNVLLARFPQKVERNSAQFSTYNFARIKSSIPSKLLDNRPDVRRASYELQAAELEVSAAKKRFYPSLSLDAEAGYEQFNSRHLTDSATAGFYGIVANLFMPVLNRKAIKAAYFSANNMQIKAVYKYEQTLIKAFSEVVNQLNAIKNANAVLELKTKQVRALNDAIEVSNVLFRAARVDYVESLFTQRDALEAQIELVEAKKQQLNASVNLYRALGGGWKGIAEPYDRDY